MTASKERMIEVAEQFRFFATEWTPEDAQRYSKSIADRVDQIVLYGFHKQEQAMLRKLVWMLWGKRIARRNALRILMPYAR